MEHFCEVLNRPEPEEITNLPAVTNVLDLNTRPPTESEVKKANIKAMKSEKAPGIDSIHADMLKADLETPTKVLTDLFKTTWEEGAIPIDWAKGLIVKLPEKRNLQKCTARKFAFPTDWFPVDTGVGQGSILSPILFLVVIDWIMRQTTSGKPRGLQWTLLSHVEDLDVAEYLEIVSVRHDHLQDKTDRLSRQGKQTGINISTTKIQVMCINNTPIGPITVDGEPLEFVKDFTYLGSLISKDNGSQKDIKARLGKARCAFPKLRPIWKSKQYSLKTKIRLYNSNVNSLLLYGLIILWKVRTSVALPGSLASYTAVTFSSAGSIPFSGKTCPMKVILGVPNWHLLGVLSLLEPHRPD